MARSACCENMGLKKGPWTSDEDQKLLTYIKEHGFGNWRTLPEKAGDDSLFHVTLTKNISLFQFCFVNMLHLFIFCIFIFVVVVGVRLLSHLSLGVGRWMAG